MNIATHSIALLAAVLPLHMTAYAADNLTPGTVMMTADAITFVPQAPGSAVQVAKLWGNRDTGPYAMLLKFPGGYAGRDHSHTADYNGITIKGIWIHTVGNEKKELPVGSYVRQVGKEIHSDACKGPEECIVLVHQDGRGDYIPAAHNH